MGQNVGIPNVDRNIGLDEWKIRAPMAV